MNSTTSSWPEVDLKSVIQPKKQKANPALLGDMPFIGLEHVEAHTGELITHGNIRDVKSTVNLFEAGDVLYSRLRPYLNKVVRPTFAGAASAEFIVFPRNTNIDARFLQHVLMHESFVSFASHINQGDRPRVDFEQIGTYRFSLPPSIEEQHRIVARLDSLLAQSKAARAELHKAIALAKRQRQAVLAKAFSGELTQDWREEKESSELKAVKLGAVAHDFSYGSSAKSQKEGAIPVLRMGNIQNCFIDWTDLVYTSDPREIKKYQLVKGDVLFNRTNSPELVGKTALYRGEQEAIYAGYLIRIRCKNELLPEFLNYCLNSPIGRQYCWQVKSDGVSQSNINAKKLAEFSFFLPSLEEQKEIVKRIEAAFRQIETMENEAKRALALAERLEQATLAKAFQGQL